MAADCLEALQSLLDIGVDYSKMERYILQPVKSVVIEILNKLRRSREKSSSSCNLDGDIMPTVDKTMHVGICRSADTDETAVAENVKKARRTLYSLISAGLHGENGLDPETSLHLYQIYVLPVLLYGMEVVFPRPKFMEVLDKFNNYNIKHLLSLLVTAADPAINLFSGTLPIEAMIHHRVLTFFGNIGRLSDSSIEKRLAERQLAVKSLDSHSWFVGLKKLCIRYRLPDCIEILEKPWSKHSWKSTVEAAINSYWNNRLQSVVPLYRSLKWLACAKTTNRALHPLIMSAGNLREVPRITVHLKIVAGIYILQTELPLTRMKLI